jgi:CPA2 family monovalent cation:H+ antiporter-2
LPEFGFLRDFALIMIVSGAAVILLRKLRQPPVLGYLLAGVLISPSVLRFPTVTDTHTIGLLADVGLVLLLFGVGLQFGWNKVRQVGTAVLIIGAVEIVSMVSLGYGLGRILGWSRPDALLLGAALHASSSAIIVKMLKDLGRLDMVSSRVVVGILLVEDFAAVLIIALLSGIGTSAPVDLGDVGLLAMKLIVFAASVLVIGAFGVPRLLDFVWRLHSKETLLISCLALSFGLALISKELGLSVAAGAFLMGALVGDSRHSEEVLELVTPVRDVFAAIFFVAIGMLIDISRFREYLLPALVVAAVFVAGKIISNTVGAMISGYAARTSLAVGMAMPQMGEFSLAIAKIGLDQGIAVAPIYPVITVTTVLTSAVAPSLSRSADRLADFLARRSPGALRRYFGGLSAWLIEARALPRARQSVKTRKASRTVLINILILLVVTGTGTYAIQYAETLARHLPVRQDVIALLLGLIILVLCVPSLVLIWRGIRALIDEAITYALANSLKARNWSAEVVRRILRGSATALLTIILGLWFIPLVSQMFFVGSVALAVPALLLAFAVYLLTNSARRIHGQLEQTFGEVFLGEDKRTHGQTDCPSAPG